MLAGSGRRYAKDNNAGRRNGPREDALFGKARVASIERVVPAAGHERVPAEVVAAVQRLSAEKNRHREEDDTHRDHDP